MTEKEAPKNFPDLGVCSELLDVFQTLNWAKPTGIQSATIPHALQGRDIIGLAETGSGKTGAFAIPIIQKWLKEKPRNFALVLTPTRELALQIQDHFENLGKSQGLRCLGLIGGLDTMEQSWIIGSCSHHIIIATPGRLVDHLENTMGFAHEVSMTQHLVLDEADRMLGLEFAEALTKILAALPSKRQTQLFSATMTKKVDKLQRTALKNPVVVEVCKKNATASGLTQLCLPTRYADRELYLDRIVHQALNKEKAGMIIFCGTCKDSFRLAFFLRNRGVRAAPLNSQLPQEKRISVLDKFRRRERDVLVATDVASRGLDIPHVGLVINYDVPTNMKWYQHRVGRTARAERLGRAITMVTPDSASMKLFHQIEEGLGGGRLQALPDPQVTQEDRIAVDEAIRLACKELKTWFSTKRKKLDIDDDDEHDREYLKMEHNLKKKRTKVN